MNKKGIWPSILAIVAVLGVGIYAYAMTYYQPISNVSINYGYKYYVDGIRVLNGNPSLKYQGVIYAPLDNILQALGYNTAVQDDGVSITSRNISGPTYYPPANMLPQNQPPVGPVAGTQSIRAFIYSIDFASDSLVVYPDGQPNNPIRLNVTPQTNIMFSDGRRATFSDLNLNMPLKVTYSSNMTKSNPPQANATSITIIQAYVTPVPIPR
ncbi:hypothetical protein AN639_00730 [Candidatus Epulonipiscium fishelsonii]|uniref:Uncharacterized protein n=1 Tax=Candidatus Epulonipiscium fishelsonii TaxID=77094 RepID=A0ACC8X7F5_9FIRM|nr:hypothetical protein AN396_12425 [Epulopiscium sp. SCG-B11WGA-EpuloA1]ONI41323.1 hypothetical protein AN639_00730 [Epulopiscium sp. SCG-B05WGA-EpuloA1]